MRRGLSGNIHEVSSLAPFDSIVHLQQGTHRNMLRNTNLAQVERSLPSIKLRWRVIRQPAIATEQIDADKAGKVDASWPDVSPLSTR